MSTEQNKQLYRRLLEEVLDKRNLAIVDDVTTPDMVEHEEVPGFPPTRDGVKQLFGMMHAAFPDMRSTIHQIVAEGDLVVARSTWQGTHRGEFLGIPASGKDVSFQVIDIVRVVDGKIAEHWGQSDNLGMLQQMGAIPEPGAPVS